MRFVIAVFLLIGAVYVFMFGYRLGVRKRIIEQPFVGTGGVWLGGLLCAVYIGLAALLIWFLKSMGWYPE